MIKEKYLIRVEKKLKLRNCGSKTIKNPLLMAYIVFYRVNYV